MGEQSSGQFGKMKNTVIVLTRRWPAAIERELGNRFAPRFNPEDRVLSPDEILERCKGATILCPTISDVIDKPLIGRLPDSIRLIASFGVGVEHIDVAAANARGVMVSNTPGVVVDDTADLAFGLIIAASRRFSEGDACVRQGLWGKFSLNFMLGRSVHGKTLGIVGMGDIGTAVARRARGFNMHIIYHNRHRNITAENELGTVYCDRFEELLEQSDIVSLHCPLTQATRHLINRQTLSKMKRSAILINAARGAVVDEAALIDALQDGTIAAAGLDVFEFEPEVSDKLCGLKNTVLIPHLGTATYEARDAMGHRVVDNIVSFMRTGRAVDEVKI